MKITKDGFIWLTVNSDEAIKIWRNEIFSLFILYDDDSEGQIESDIELSNAIAHGMKIGIEVGQIEDRK